MSSPPRSLRRPSWRHLPILALGLALVVLAAVQTIGAAPAPEPQVDFHEDARPALKKGEDDCPTRQPLSCNATANGQLAAGDCQDDQGRSLDVYTFSGTAGEMITVTLKPTGFEGDLELFDPTFEDFLEVEGEFPGQQVELTTTLNQTAPWFLVVKANDPGQGGAYSLSLQCGDGGNPPPPPPEDDFFLDPAYPDFQFRVRIGDQGSEILGARENGCISETVCVSGALAGRTEVFVRILGPRPNGFLWPTIVRFTPSRVVVDIRQVSTGQVQTYVLNAVPPAQENLSGRQDRTGFLP